MTQAQISLIARYVHTIKNAQKRAYAAAWFNYRRGAALEPSETGLSMMGAQAVRLRIDDMFRAAAERFQQSRHLNS